MLFMLFGPWLKQCFLATFTKPRTVSEHDDSDSSEESEVPILLDADDVDTRLNIRKWMLFRAGVTNFVSFPKGKNIAPFTTGTGGSTNQSSRSPSKKGGKSKCVSIICTFILYNCYIRCLYYADMHYISII
jgi:hypothetical protein